jgi:hypothetical protein
MVCLQHNGTIMPIRSRSLPLWTPLRSVSVLLSSRALLFILHGHSNHTILTLIGELRHIQRRVRSSRGALFLLRINMCNVFYPHQ